MRTATSALFIALCILFAATYATALRRPTYASLHRNIANKYRTSSDIRSEPPPYNPYPFSDSELSIRHEGDVSIPFDRLPPVSWPIKKPYGPLSDRRYTTLPLRPKYELYSDAEFRMPGGYTPPYNPRRYMLSDAELSYRPPVYTTVPEYPRRELFADRSVPTWAQPSPYNPTPTFWSDEEYDEEYDEEEWGVNGNIGNGGQWNLGGSYTNNGFTGSASVGNGGRYNVGGSYTNGGFTGGVTAGNGGSWSANAGYNTKVGGGNLSVGGQVSNGGNWGVGATYNLRF